MMKRKTESRASWCLYGAERYYTLKQVNSGRNKYTKENEGGQGDRER